MSEQNGQMMRVPQAGEVTRQDFGGNQLTRVAETATAALAAQAKAAVEARFIVALQRPRDTMQARQRLLDDCKRPAFADKAIYRKPIGQGVEGPSIRLAEAAARAMTNINTDVFAIYDDADKRIVRISAVDLEANLTYTKDVTVHKVVERSQVKEGQKVLGQRINSKGKPVFLVSATDDEILDRESALASKAMRTCLLRLIPGDILEEAQELCRQTMRNASAKDPAAAKKAMCDAFASIGVSVAQLADYLGHGVDNTTPDEIAHMRMIFTTIRDGESTWADEMESRKKGGDEAKPAEETAQPAASAPQPQASGEKPKNLTDVAAKAKAKRDGEQSREPGSDDDKIK